ncbi:hypothetical protein Scep_016215 [Stephania cephalantha]|uniref:Uncharacterized protein n=1 Tax=Stephania cephalantha TaxID=152367 RepID=A0AAP0IMF2_9MAGN
MVCGREKEIKTLQAAKKKNENNVPRSPPKTPKNCQNWVPNAYFRVWFCDTCAEDDQMVVMSLFSGLCHVSECDWLGLLAWMTWRF